tara:strand:- start:12832 stop:13326 length:495 start_codon:yes stop_codon:yes gene_type:complete
MKSIDLQIASDHRGMELKDKISEWLTPLDDDNPTRFGITLFQDAGVYNNKKKADYPDVVQAVVKDFATWDKVKAGWKVYNMGIIICGSGFGVSIAANRFQYIRGVVCRTPKDAEMARKHNDANVLCLGADFTSFAQSKKIIETFLTTKFEGGRHKKRVEKLGKL